VNPLAKQSIIFSYLDLVIVTLLPLYYPLHVSLIPRGSVHEDKMGTS